MAGLDPVVESPEATAGSLKHSAYLTRNHTVGHDESPNLPGYSAEGRRAGMTGNVAGGTGGVFDERSVVEGWMTVPFHGIGMIGPTFKRFGFGSATAGSSWSATLSLFWDDDPDAGGAAPSDPDINAVINQIKTAYPDVPTDRGYEASWSGSRIAMRIEGRTFLIEDGAVKEISGGPDPDVALRSGSTGKKPLVWPGDGSGVPLVRYGGNEYPDPLTSCPGYRTAGLPIYLARGGQDTEVASASIVDDQGKPYDFCVLSATTYRSPDPAAQSTGRSVLGGYGAIVLLPKTSLEFGHRYDVTVTTTDGQRTAWSFRTTVDEIVPPAGHALAGQPTPGRSSQQPGGAASTAKPASVTPTTKAAVPKTAKPKKPTRKR